MLGARAPLLECGGEFPHAHKASPPRCCFWLASHVNVRKSVVGIMVLYIFTMIVYTQYIPVPLTSFNNRMPELSKEHWTLASQAVSQGTPSTRESDPAPTNRSDFSSQHQSIPETRSSLASQREDPREYRSDMRLRRESQVLIFVDSMETELANDIFELLRAIKIRYNVLEAGEGLPELSALTTYNYSVIIFETLSIYAYMDEGNKMQLHKYCKDKTAGIIGFATPGEELVLPGIEMTINLRLKDATINPDSSLLRLTRAGGTIWGPLPGEFWSVFRTSTVGYEPVAWAVRRDENTDAVTPLPIALHDHGKHDNVCKVLFGSGIRFWLFRMLFLDALSYLSHGQLSLSLDKWILVDIDHIFDGKNGSRLIKEDVEALLDSQAALQKLVPGFRFNLGYSGQFFHQRTELEKLGDESLLEHKDQFLWFSQLQVMPHFLNDSQIEAEMMLNKQFAIEHGIPTNSCYSVTPRYSGIYPVHESMYDAWKKIWDIKVTSTEEYPHSDPPSLRGGFRYKGIMVLPKQSSIMTMPRDCQQCRLRAKMGLWNPKSRKLLDRSIQGGDLFKIVMNNPVNVFQSHVSDYGKDRVGLYIFESLVKFLKNWTNVRLASAPPLALAKEYFKLRPDELDPIWGYPCQEIRHMTLWAKHKWCYTQIMPKFLVIGPQKTGSTDLYNLLTMHPALAGNLHHPTTKEELQFFNNKNYFKGLDWYMSFFPRSLITLVTRHTFEKSSTYFDDVMVPRRAHELLPWTEIVAVLIPPAKRAYSWYQHIRSHGDPVANNYTFHTVITANDSAPKPLRDLLDQCVNPGKYIEHLENWLTRFNGQQVHIVDGTLVRSDPATVMTKLQKLFGLRPRIKYKKVLKFDEEKGVFCQTSNNITKCVNKPEGQTYPPMEERSAKYLQEFYAEYNMALSKLYVRLGRPLAQWLKIELSLNQTSKVPTTRGL